MTQTTTPSSPTHYTPVLAACSSYGLESSFGRPREEVLPRRTSDRNGGHSWFSSDREPVDYLVVVTTTTESLPAARRRVRVELAAIVDDWTGRTPRSRRRLWAQWAQQYPSLEGIDPVAMWDTTTHSQDEAMVDLVRLMKTEPDAVVAWLTKARNLISARTRKTIPTDIGTLVAVALESDCDYLATTRRPFLTLYSRARKQSRHAIVASKGTQRPVTATRAFASNYDDPDRRSKEREIIYAPFGQTNPIETIDTMVSIDGICRNYNQTRWDQLLNETLHNTPTLNARTRRRTRATFRPLIKAAA